MSPARHLIAVSATLFTWAVVCDQLPAQRKLEQEARALGWQFDYSRAKVIAARVNKPLMLVFRCVP